MAFYFQLSATTAPTVTHMLSLANRYTRMISIFAMADPAGKVFHARLRLCILKSCAPQIQGLYRFSLVMVKSGQKNNGSNSREGQQRNADPAHDNIRKIFGCAIPKSYGNPSQPLHSSSFGTLFMKPADQEFCIYFDHLLPKSVNQACVYSYSA